MNINKIKKYLRFYRNRNDLNNIINSIDKVEFEKIRKKYINVDPSPGSSKYLNLEHWIRKRLNDYFELELHKKSKLKILDIGTGTGYFPYICNYYGHTTRAIDLDSTGLYNELTGLLSIDRVTWTINAFKKLPELNLKFNLVSAFMVCFNNHVSSNVWREKEWAFFLKNLVDDHMEANGEIFFLLNPETDGKFYTPELKEFFLELGAVINKGKIYFPTIKQIQEVLN